MTVVSWNDLLDKSVAIDQPVRLTVGVFDGLHIGHRQLLNGIAVGRQNSIPVVFTFRQNPAQILTPESFTGLILTFRQKLERLEAFGIGMLVVIDFSTEFSKLSGRDFIGLLRNNLTIEKIVVGYNFRFGRDRDTGAGDLRAMLADTGIEVQVNGPVFWRDGPVSSSRIRKTIQEADFSEAGVMLAAAYRLDLREVVSSREGERMRIECSSLSQVLPKPGAYRVTCEGEGISRPGELTVGEEFLTLVARGSEDTATIVFQ
jgi:riboflavin kinase/FMN adenylyltransferase